MNPRSVIPNELSFKKSSGFQGWIPPRALRVQLLIFNLLDPAEPIYKDDLRPRHPLGVLWCCDLVICLRYLLVDRLYRCRKRCVRSQRRLIMLNVERLVGLDRCLCLWHGKVGGRVAPAVLTGIRESTCSIYKRLLVGKAMSLHPKDWNTELIIRWGGRRWVCVSIS